MRKETIKELSAESFGAYGFFANMINPSATKLGNEPIEFYRDMVQLDLGGPTIASFSVCRVASRPAVVDLTEFHSCCSEGILSLDSDILIHVAPASPNNEVPLEDIEIFRVPVGTLVVLRPGVWHHAPFTAGSGVANVLIVLPERTYANDCEIFEIPKDQQVEIQGA